MALRCLEAHRVDVLAGHAPRSSALLAAHGAHPPEPAAPSLPPRAAKTADRLQQWHFAIGRSGYRLEKALGDYMRVLYSHSKLL